MDIERLDEGLGGVSPKRRVIRSVEERRRMVYRLALLGLTEAEMADFFGVDVRTFTYYKQTDDLFREALLSGRDDADSKVAESLYDCANGYYYDEEVSHMWKGEIIKTTLKKFRPKDAWAAAKILALRHKQLWSETHKYELTNTNVNINKVDFSGLTTEELLVLERIQKRQLTQKIGES